MSARNGKPSHLFTRDELNELDKYARNEATAIEIADTLHRSDRIIYKWLASLGIKRKRVFTAKRQKNLKKCAKCEILLSEAAEMDGDGDDTYCLYCLQMMGVKPMVHWNRLPSVGSDISTGLISYLGYAKQQIGEFQGVRG